MELATIVFAIFTALLTGLVGILAVFVNSYWGQRNKNLADIEALNKITTIVEEVRNNFAQISGRKNLMFQESKNSIVDFYTSMEALINKILYVKFHSFKSSDINELEKFKSEIQELNEKAYYERCKLGIIISDDVVVKEAESYFKIVHALYMEMHKSSLDLLVNLGKEISLIDKIKMELLMGSSSNGAVEFAKIYKEHGELRIKVHELRTTFVKKFPDARRNFINITRKYLNKED
jgi:hypothetical protein